MFGFQDAEQTAHTPLYTIWRQPLLVGMEVRGVLDDAASRAWRAALDQEFSVRGPVGFFSLNVTTMDPQNSMAARAQSALWAREHLKKMEFAVLLTGGKSGPLVVLRAALRVIGMANVALVNDDHVFERALNQMRQGQRPDVRGLGEGAAAP